jgi:hypothetical protein
VTESNTQNTARSVVDLVSQAIQFGGGDVTTTDPAPALGSSYAFCVGNEQFSYTVGYQLKDNPQTGVFQTYHALVRATVAGCSGAAPQNVRQPSINGRELLAPNMRLADLQVTSLGDNLFQVDVRVVYGDDDVLYSPSDPGNPQGASRSDASCRGNSAGTQFCAVSELSTIVTKRVQ